MFLDYPILDVLRLPGNDFGSRVFDSVTGGYITQLDKATVLSLASSEPVFTGLPETDYVLSNVALQ